MAVVVAVLVLVTAETSTVTPGGSLSKAEALALARSFLLLDCFSVFCFDNPALVSDALPVDSLSSLLQEEEELALNSESLLPSLLSRRRLFLAAVAASPAASWSLVLVGRVWCGASQATINTPGRHTIVPKFKAVLPSF